MKLKLLKNNYFLKIKYNKHLKNSIIKIIKYLRTRLRYHDRNLQTFFTFVNKTYRKINY